MVRTRKKVSVMKMVSGDILLSQAQVLVHGVAPNDDFAQGLALSLREQWPAMYKDFRHYCKTSHPKPGELWTWPTTDHRQIVNLLTQESAYDHGSKPGKAKLSYVSSALKKLALLAKEENFQSLALPRLATGVGGLDWKDVLPVIEEHLSSLEIPIWIYEEFHAGQKAQE